METSTIICVGIGVFVGDILFWRKDPVGVRIVINMAVFFLSLLIFAALGK